MFTVLLFIIYFILLALALNLIAKRKKLGLSTTTIFCIFAFKIFLGCTYGYIFLTFYHGDDTWMMFRESLDEYHKLIHQPFQFVHDMLPNPAFWATHKVSKSIQIYLEDLEYWTIPKLLAIFHIFSRGNYYIDVLFFDFVSIFGLLILYKLAYALFPTKKQWLIAILFFLPMTSFWLSGIRAEGLLLLFMMMALYYALKWPSYSNKILPFIYIVIGIAGTLILRVQLLFVLAPALIATGISFHKSGKPIYYFTGVYALCIILFFASIWVSPQKNLSTPIIERQQQFLRLQGNTAFHLDSLQPSLKSFAKILPQAFSNSFLRPTLFEAKGILQVLTAFDILLFFAMLLIAFLWHEPNWKKTFQAPLALFFAFYGISEIILIGYIVPFPGAIVRYKTIPEIFLFILLVGIIDFKKLSSMFFKKK